MKNNIKLIACDLDGTLLLHGAQELNPEIFPLIRNLKRMGILFVAASGRQYPNLRRLFEPVQDEIAYIAENGALCYYKEELLLETYMKREIGEQILREIRAQQHCEILLSGKNTSYLESNNADYIHHMTHVVKNQVSLVKDIMSVSEPYYKISAYDERGIEAIQHTFLEKFQSEVNVVVSGNIWLDMLSKETNKGAALSCLTKKRSILPSECLAFGDNFNDIEMLQFVGESYAMDHAHAEVKAHATHTCHKVETILKEILENE